MKALVWDGSALRVDAARADIVPGDEVAVQVIRAGVCSTDLEIVKGYMGFVGVLGHEFVGRVIDGPAHLRGKRVVGEINCVCHRCDMCVRGLPTHCRSRTVLGIAGRDGAFAEWTKLPAENLHVVPDQITDDQAVFVEPVAAACEILTQVSIGQNDRVAVIGAGRLGTLVAQVLKPHAGELRLFSRTLSQAKRCEAMGLTLETIDSAPSSTFDVVVEASGSAAGFEHAMRITRPRGTIVLKSTYAGNTGPNPTVAVIHEMTIVGSRCGPFEKAIDALKTGCVKIEPLIAARYGLDDAVAAMTHAATPGIGKVMIEMA